MNLIKISYDQIYESHTALAVLSSKKHWTSIKNPIQ